MDVPLTNVSKCFDTALNVGLLRCTEPGAVADPEGRLEQLDEDGLICLREEQRYQATACQRQSQWVKTENPAQAAVWGTNADNEGPSPRDNAGGSTFLDCKMVKSGHGISLSTT